MKSAIAALIIAGSASAVSIAGSASAVTTAGGSPDGNSCGNDWIYEWCSDMYFRRKCDGECWSDGTWGWVYWGDETSQEYCVSEYEFYANWVFCW